MAQDLLKISLENFELQLYKFTNSALIELNKNIIEFKWDIGKKFDLETEAGLLLATDLERKHSKIIRELQRRGILNKDTKLEHILFERKHNFKKRVF